MLPALRIWAAGLALIASGCREREAGGAPPEPTPPAAQEEAAEEPAGPAPPAYQRTLAMAAEAHARSEDGDDEAAATLYRSAIGAFPTDARREEPEFMARVHDGLGRALHNCGQLDEAELHLTIALAIRSTLPGTAGETERGISEGHLGLLSLVRGRYGEAGRLFHAALAHTPADEPGLLIHRHDCFGRYHLALRAHDLAAGHFEQALRLATVDAAADDPLVLDLRHNLALAQFRAGRTGEALAEAEAILADLPVSPAAPLRRAGVLNLAGTIQAATGDLGSAERRIAEALAMVEAETGPGHPAVATFQANLGAVRLQAGRARQALAPLERARDILRANVADHHQELVEVLYQIAACHLDLPGSTGTREAVIEARGAADGLMSSLIEGGSERELLTFRSQVDIHSIVCRFGDPGLIADSLLAAKGRIMEAILERRTTSRQARQRIAELSSELDRHLLQQAPEAKERIVELRRRIEERPSGQESPPSVTGKPVPWQDVRDALSGPSAFIDFVRFIPSGRRDNQARYGAVVIVPEGPPRWIPLGEESMTGRLDLLLRSLDLRADILRHGEGRPGVPMAPLLVDLYRSFWMPVAEALPDETREVIVCPEEKIHLLPFAVLRNPNGRFLCEEIPGFRIVDSGRNIVRPPQPPVDMERPWAILGVSEFGPQRRRSRRKNNHWSPAWTEILTSLDDLPTVRAEIESLRRIAPEGSIVLRDGKATVSALRQLDRPPAILHLASHGFHVPLGGSRDLSADPSALYENGVILAAGSEPGGNSILFPEEVATLDLRGTRLVTLSTCRSALGRPVSGEGLLGLGRGFTKAGARNVLASLWEIPDQSTATFMVDFYRRLVGGDDPAVLLWTMQARRFGELRGADPAGDQMETGILSFGGFVVTAP